MTQDWLFDCDNNNNDRLSEGVLQSMQVLSAKLQLSLTTVHMIAVALSS